MGKLSAADGKVSLVATLKQSFDYCTEALAKVDDSALALEVSMFGHPSHQSRGAMMIVLAADWADHYSTAASYLRLNGILPPRGGPQEVGRPATSSGCLRGSSAARRLYRYTQPFHGPWCLTLPADRGRFVDHPAV